MTTLRKPVIVTYIAGNPGSPGDPGRPYIPGHWVNETVQVCGWEPVAGWQNLFNSLTRKITLGPGQFYTQEIAFVTANWVCHPYTNSYWMPAQTYIPPTPPVPATPAQTLRDFQLGWNGRADSIAQLSTDGGFAFTLANTIVGGVVGFSSAPASNGYGDITHGIYATHGTANICESGVTVPGTTFAYGNTDVLMVRRVQGNVTYWNGTTLLYTSTVPSTGNVELTAALYSGGDSVYDASLVLGGGASSSMLPIEEIAQGTANLKYAIGQAQMSPLRAIAGINGGAWKKAVGVMGPMTGYAQGFSDSTLRGTGAGVMEPMQAVGNQGVYVSVTLPALVSIAGVAYAQAFNDLPALVGVAEGYPDAPAWAVSAGFLSFMTGTGAVLVGEVGGGAGTMGDILSLASDRSIGIGEGSLAPLTSAGKDFGTPDEANVVSVLGAISLGVAETEAFVVMDVSAQIGCIFTVNTLRDADVSSSASASGSWGTSQILDALLKSFASTKNLGFDSGDLSAWVLNTKGNGTTRYTGYNFNSFAKIAGHYYGAMGDGLYRLDGATDNGAMIAAAVNLGNNNFGTSRLKNIPQAYVGVASDNTVVVKVVADGQTNYYTARTSSVDMSTQRVDLGRGLRANYFELEVQNKDGGVFDLNSVEFTAIQLSRRI